MSDTHENVTDAALVSLVTKGDSNALGQIYDRHSRKLYSLALRIMGDSRDAEEVLQDTFVQLWQKSLQFDLTRGALIAWLLTITRYRAISRLRLQRSRGRSKSLSDNDVIFPEIASPSGLDEHIARELVSTAFVGLPENQRNAITLAYFDGFTCEEIADRTQSPVGTVKTRLRSGLKTMRKTLSTRLPPHSQQCEQHACTLNEILITDQLVSRTCRQRDPRQARKAVDALTGVSTNSPDRLMDTFLQIPLDLCRAGTGGLSLLETTSNGEQIFRWTHLAGVLAKHVGGTTPRHFSPCGVTLDFDSPQLFEYPARYFKYFDSVPVPIVEGLVIPFHVGGKTEGTVWIVSHDRKIRFDSEDVRVMSSIAEFVGCTIHLKGLLRGASS